MLKLDAKTETPLKFIVKDSSQIGRHWKAELDSNFGGKPIPIGEHKITPHLNSNLLNLPPLIVIFSINSLFPSIQFSTDQVQLLNITKSITEPRRWSVKKWRRRRRHRRTPTRPRNWERSLAKWIRMKTADWDCSRSRTHWRDSTLKCRFILLSRLSVTPIETEMESLAKTRSISSSSTWWAKVMLSDFL